MQIRNILFALMLPMYLVAQNGPEETQAAQPVNPRILLVMVYAYINPAETIDEAIESVHSLAERSTLLQTMLIKANTTRALISKLQDRFPEQTPVEIALSLGTPGARALYTEPEPMD